MSHELTIQDVRIRPPEAVSEADAQRGERPRLRVEIDVAASGPSTLHVFATRKDYAYDAATKTLTVTLGAEPPTPPPGVTLISDHPRVPTQVGVPSGGSATLTIPVPTTVRTPATPGDGLGARFSEEPIGPIEHVEVRAQYADVPFQRVIEESPARQRERLRDHGRTITTRLTPTKES